MEGPDQVLAAVLLLSGDMGRARYDLEVLSWDEEGWHCVILYIRYDPEHSTRPWPRWRTPPAGSSRPSSPPWWPTCPSPTCNINQQMMESVILIKNSSLSHWEADLPGHSYPWHSSLWVSGRACWTRGVTGSMISSRLMDEGRRGDWWLVTVRDLWRTRGQGVWPRPTQATNTIHW